ncbi:MAG: type II toxin-antitoxin system PemK/MazF family toxin [Pseudomonadota bacterium]|nr:type II toxin-antitoxin system PemK/MazF family toxin [Pseudomonadota bacterium]
MPITIHPRVGQILLCDFSQGFKEPEMVKSQRPVIVVASRIQGRNNLVTVVALSTVQPTNEMPFHYKLPKASMPQLGRFQEKDTWVKGDMLYTVGFHRLDLIKLGKRDPITGKRAYFSQRLGRTQMTCVFKCILHGLNLSKLVNHL